MILVASSAYFGQAEIVSLDPEQTKLAATLRRALAAMQDWPAERRLQYLVLLGIKNRKAEYTRDFGGEAAPERDSVAAIASATDARPLLKLLYVLKHGDDICLDAPTARSITGEPSVGRLIAVVDDAVDAKLVRRTAAAARKLLETDRDSLIGLKLTDDGKQYVNSVLHLDERAVSAL